MNWYHVDFMAITGEPKPGIWHAQFRCDVQADSPVDALYVAVRERYGHGVVTQWVIEGDVEIPVLWEFENFNLSIEEEDAVLDELVYELTPAEVMELMGVPTLFDLETTPPVTNRTPEQLEHADRLVWTGIQNARKNEAKVNAIARGNRKYASSD